MLPETMARTKSADKPLVEENESDNKNSEFEENEPYLGGNYRYHGEFNKSAYCQR